MRHVKKPQITVDEERHIFKENIDEHEENE